MIYALTFVFFIALWFTALVVTNMLCIANGKISRIDAIEFIFPSFMWSLFFLLWNLQ